MGTPFPPPPPLVCAVPERSLLRCPREHRQSCRCGYSCVDGLRAGAGRGPGKMCGAHLHGLHPLRLDHSTHCPALQEGGFHAGVWIERGESSGIWARRGSEVPPWALRFPAAGLCEVGGGLGSPCRPLPVTVSLQPPTRTLPPATVPRARASAVRVLCALNENVP